jgi:hypothetical protein
VQDIKDTLCYVAGDLTKEKGTTQHYQLPDGQVRPPQLHCGCIRSTTGALVRTDCLSTVCSTYTGVHTTAIKYIVLGRQLAVRGAEFVLAYCMHLHHLPL